MSDEQNQTQSAILDALLKQLERIADSLQTIAEVAKSDRKEGPKPFSTSASHESK